MHTPTLTVGAGRRVVRASLATIAEGDAGLAMSWALDRVGFGPTRVLLSVLNAAAVGDASPSRAERSHAA